jgi:hypothetical protein
LRLNAQHLVRVIERHGRGRSPGSRRR